MPKLPNAERAVVDIEKLRDYSLNPQHNPGKHKARVFQAALGLMKEDAGWLRDYILRAVLAAEAIEGSPSPFGQKYVVDLVVVHETQSAFVRTAWIVEYGTNFPRLTSCYVK